MPKCNFNFQGLDFFSAYKLKLMASSVAYTTHYVYEEDVSLTIESLEKVSNLLFQQFSDNHIKANKDKRDVLLSSNENIACKRRYITITKQQFWKAVKNQNLYHNEF